MHPINCSPGKAKAKGPKAAFNFNYTTLLNLYQKEKVNELNSAKNQT